VTWKVLWIRIWELWKSDVELGILKVESKNGEWNAKFGKHRERIVMGKHILGGEKDNSITIFFPFTCQFGILFCQILHTQIYAFKDKYPLTSTFLYSFYYLVVFYNILRKCKIPSFTNKLPTYFLINTVIANLPFLFCSFEKKNHSI